jgi:hypothetical protein
MLRRLLEHKKEEVTSGWRKLHNEELHNLYPSLSISRMLKPKRIRRDEGCSAHDIAQKCIKILAEYLNRRDHLEELIVH